MNKKLQASDPSDHIIALYVEHAPQYMIDLENASERGDNKEVMFHCHKMKSVMKMMGFDNIAEALEKIEQERPEKDLLCRRVRHISAMVDLTLRSLKR